MPEQIRFRMQFELTEEQGKKFEEWRKSLPKKDYGAIGGGTWFMFCPTGLGDIVKVRRDDGYEIDLTDDESW